MAFLQKITRLPNTILHLRISEKERQALLRHTSLRFPCPTSNWVQLSPLSTDMSSLNTTVQSRKTAGIIIIGDEILKGQVLDTNSHYLAKRLYSLGIKLKRISVVGDLTDEIAQEVKKFSDQFDVVFTTGGIGPTHDDVTYVGVAKAFNEEVVRNKIMGQMIHKWLGHKGYSEEVIMRMAEMPASAQLLFDPKERAPLSSFPVVAVRNVYVFPGIPKFLESMFPRMETILKDLSSTIYSGKVFVNRDEISITPQLDKVVDRFKDTVVFGSYPVMGNLYYSTRLTLESSHEGHVESAKKYLHELLPLNSIVDYDDEPLESAGDKVYAITENSDHPLHSAVRHAVSIIEECLEKYGTDGLWICFNGGKDCTVLLHLFFAVVVKKAPQCKDKLKGLCITIEDPFPETESFMKDTAKKYNLDLHIFDGPIKAGLTNALEKFPNIKAVLMGTRRTDPSGKDLDYLQMTDSSWPQAMRVSPILDWSYHNLWMFLRSLSLPYCILYDQGYTSLGSRKNTGPNPRLLKNGEQNGNKYKPAYELDNGASERSARH